MGVIIKNLNQKVNLIRLKIHLYFLHQEEELEQMFDEEEPKKNKPIDHDDLSVKEIEEMIVGHQKEIDTLKLLLKKKLKKLEVAQDFFLKKT
jgi:uncharacterized small protein (DUF1192 family)